MSSWAMTAYLQQQRPPVGANAIRHTSTPKTPKKTLFRLWQIHQQVRPSASHRKKINKPGTQRQDCMLHPSNPIRDWEQSLRGLS